MHLSKFSGSCSPRVRNPNVYAIEKGALVCQHAVKRKEFLQSCVSLVVGVQNDSDIFARPVMDKHIDAEVVSEHVSIHTDDRARRGIVKQARNGTKRVFQRNGGRRRIIGTR